MNEHEQMTGVPVEMPNDTPHSVPANKPVKQEESWLEVVKTIVYALLIAGVIRTVLFQPFNIPSESMQATLLVGDYLFVSKGSYGYSRYSLPWGYLWPLPQGRVLSAPPERGDVAVFKTPQDNKTDFIKRVIGLPGDRIQMKDGVLHINDKAVPKVQVASFVEDLGGYKHEVAQYRETLPNGKTYLVLDRQPNGNLDNTGVFVVPAGHYFMMGDNRDNSDDSRAEVGYVPFENLVGKAEILFFSTDGSARLWEIWKWPLAIRYERMGQIVD